MSKIDLSNFKTPINFKLKFLRYLWYLIWLILVRPIPRKSLNFWKIFLLRLFGAKVHKTSTIYSSAKIYMPWNLEMHEYSCMASNVDCYNPDLVILKSNSIVSQNVFLCAASHKTDSPHFELVTAPIIIKEQAWVGAYAFIGMGVAIGEGAVVGATESFYKSVKPWNIVGGNPAKFIKKRKIID